jgi:hypothetical protein
MEKIIAMHYKQSVNVMKQLILNLAINRIVKFEI